MGITRREVGMSGLSYHQRNGRRQVATADDSEYSLSVDDAAERYAHAGYPIIDLQHHRGAAAERPMINDFPFGVDLPDHRAGGAKKLRPV